MKKFRNVVIGLALAAVVAVPCLMKTATVVNAAEYGPYSSQYYYNQMMEQQQAYNNYMYGAQQEAFAQNFAWNQETFDAQLRALYGVQEYGYENQVFDYQELLKQVMKQFNMQ